MFSWFPPFAFLISSISLPGEVLKVAEGRADEAYDSAYVSSASSGLASTGLRSVQEP